MKVVIIGNSMAMLTNFRGPLLQALVARGHAVTACVPDRGAAGAALLRQWGVALRRVPMSQAGLNPLRELITLRALRRLLLDLQPDAVLSYTIKPVIWGSLAAKRIGVPGVYSLISGLGYAFLESTSLKQRLVHGAACWLYRRALPGTDGVMFQNRDDERLFRQLRLLPHSVPSTVINGSGVDLEHFAPRPLPELPVFLLMARLIADKGVREYQRAALQVKSTVPQARFLLAGGLDQNPSAITQAELNDWQAQGGIEYLGRLDDVRPALAACSVYVLPSYREGTPRSTLEALATGRAVVTTDVPGCRETVTDGVNGLLIPPRNVPALAAAMLSLAQDAAARQRMGATSLQLAREKYDVHKVNQVILETMGL